MMNSVSSSNLTSLSIPLLLEKENDKNDIRNYNFLHIFIFIGLFTSAIIGFFIYYFVFM